MAAIPVARGSGRRHRIAVLPLVSIACGLLIWEIIGRQTPRVIFAPASAAIGYIVNQTLHLVLVEAALSSLGTLLAGYLLAVVIALPLGFAMGRVRWVHDMLDPVMTGIYAIPPVAFIPFLIVWFGLFVQSRIAVVFIMCVFEMLVIAMSGARALNERLVDVARSLMASRVRIIRSVVVPASLPFIFTALRVGLVRAVAGMITAELLLTPANLGKLLLTDAARFNTAGMLGIIMTVALIGLAAQRLLLVIERRVIKGEARR